MGKRKIRDKKLREFLKQGGREGSKQDFLTLLKWTTSVS